MWMKVPIVLCALMVPALAFSQPNVVKDPEGKTIALVLDCNTCKDPKKGKNCVFGAEEGYLNGAPCGKCLMDSNYGARIAYAYDLHFTGKLLDLGGKPLVNRFVRLFLPNTWTVRTRTSEDGVFRLMLGATVERKGKAVIVDLGERRMAADSKAPYYALYMVPEAYKPCEASK